MIPHTFALEDLIGWEISIDRNIPSSAVGLLAWEVREVVLVISLIDHELVYGPLAHVVTVGPWWKRTGVLSRKEIYNDCSLIRKREGPVPVCHRACCQMFAQDLQKSIVELALIGVFYWLVLILHYGR